MTSMSDPTADTAYCDLIAHVSRTAALGDAAGVLSWDQETMMPPDGATHRAEQMGALSATIHSRTVDARVAQWLDAIDPAPLDGPAQANLRRIRRDHERAARLPERLAEEIARTTAAGQRIWAEARAADDFAAFAPTLEKVLDLRREEAGLLADQDTDPYDALLDDYEPGMRTAELAAVLDALRPALVSLHERIAASPVTPPRLNGTFERERQMAVARNISDAYGYRWGAGRLDLAVHPFCSGFGPGDVRITTRVDEADPFNCLYSTAHELGHALYEQGLPAARSLEPAGRYASMGVHESQSRLWENQIGRSRAFCRWLHREMAGFAAYDLPDAEALYRAVNRVETGYIRTEADEVHYNLHVMMRFDLERALIAGDLEVRDLEGAWNERFERDFGLAVDKPSNGVLQDVHWSIGLFGYFPTYTLGNVFSAELFAKLRAELGDVDAMAERGAEAGGLAPVLDWLRTNVHARGAELQPMALMEEVVGHRPTPKPLIDYLETKFSDLYELE